MKKGKRGKNINSNKTPVASWAFEGTPAAPAPGGSKGRGDGSTHQPAMLIRASQTHGKRFAVHQQRATLHSLSLIPALVFFSGLLAKNV